MLFEKYLDRYADNPKTPPVRAFNKYCDKKQYLKGFKYGVYKLEVMSIVQSEDQSKNENSNMKWIFKYKDTPVFVRYYSNSVKSK